MRAVDCGVGLGAVGAAFTTTALVCIGNATVVVELRDKGAAMADGFRCPKCTGRMSVKNSRTSRDGNIKRVRACGQCKHRITTYEIDAALLVQMYDLIDTVVPVGARRAVTFRS